MNVDEEEQQMFDHMNELTKKFGHLILKEHYEQAFQLTERKLNYQRRVNIIEQLIKYFENTYGKIKDITIAGTTYFPDYLTMTLLQFVSDSGAKAGIPIIWNSKEGFWDLDLCLRSTQ